MAQFQTSEPLRKLSWGLVLSTYKREEVLRQCVALAASQTRPPSEIIVIDASQHWERTRDRLSQETMRRHPQIRWAYVPAERLSLPAQRNQGLRLATADVVFLIDDDALMYPNCAEEVMNVYEADRRGLVSGVGAVAVDAPPHERSGVAETAAANAITWTRHLEGWLTDVTRILVPYDGHYPAHQIPSECRDLNVSTACLFNGFRMTFRRERIVQAGFEECLERYAPAEDLDASYRVSRHGALLNAHDARLFHAQAAGGRLSRETISTLAALNIGALLRLNCANRQGALRRYRRFLVRRATVELLGDIARRRWRMPRFRGVLRAVRYVEEIFRHNSSEAFRVWYIGLQKSVIESLQR